MERLKNRIDFNFEDPAMKIDFSWSFGNEGGLRNEETDYRNFLRENYSFDPKLHNVEHIKFNFRES